MIKFVQKIEDAIGAELVKIEAQYQADKSAIEAKIKEDRARVFEVAKGFLATEIANIESGLENLAIKLDDEAVAALLVLKTKLQALQSAAPESAEPAPIVQA